MSPTDSPNRVRRSHEQWFHFTKEPRYFAAVDEIRESHKDSPNAAESSIKRIDRARQNLSESMATGEGKHRWVPDLNPLGKLPGSVWNLTYWECVDRIERGWAPTGICVECGEGRRPVVDRDSEVLRSGVYPTYEGRSGGSLTDHTRKRDSATITGYACACPEPTAETKPPVILLEPPPLSVAI